MYYLGFDVGGTNIKIGVINEDLKILRRSSMGFPKNLPADDVIALMADEAKSILTEMKLPPDKIERIGIAAAGSVDVSRGAIVYSHNLKFYNVPMVEMMRKHFPDTDINLINDADAAALAEQRGGTFKGKNTAVLLTIGTGVGGAIILGGKLFKGGLGHGNEIGHITLMHGGPPCTCGNKGCMETLCSGTWIAVQGRETIARNTRGMIYERAGGDIEKVDAKMVLDCARDGDTTAKEIFNEYIDYLSSAMASLAVIFDPEVISLGGGISLAGDFLFDPLRDLVARKSFFKIEHEILPAKFGNDAGIIGASLVSSI
ncbi:MAG TPA: ROK family protein [Anaerovoracaceae bacterium]|nr:ROK family protein [Anaerovoracaceae bacterium]